MKTVLPNDITVVLTSCGRWDMLVESIDSFLQHHEPSRFLLVEDSADHAFADRLQARYPNIEVLLNDPRLGQHKSIDRVYGEVTTPLIIHLEDDWIFQGPAEIDHARALLDRDPAIVGVCFSIYKRLKLRHRIFARHVRDSDRMYSDMRQAHRESYGYSFYPTLVRRSTWEEHGPFAKYQNERAISRHMKAKGLGVVHQIPGVGLHVGSGRSVFDPARTGEKRRVTGALRRRLLGRGRFEPVTDEPDAPRENDRT